MKAGMGPDTNFYNILGSLESLAVMGPVSHSMQEGGGLHQNVR